MDKPKTLDGSTSGCRLSPERLARDFGAGTEPAVDVVGKFFRALVAPDRSAARQALDRWKLLVSGACGQQPGRSLKAATALAKCHQVAGGERKPAELLFAVQTYYAVLVKMLVRQLTGQDEAPADGPYAWYVGTESEPILEAVEGLATRLAGCKVDPPEQDPCGGGDLLVDLYEAVFPRRVRHALGEYYTPGRLARHVLDEAGYQGGAGARLLDPACGSGTFLVEAVNRCRRRGEADCEDGRLDKARLCRQILDGVVGFDLHPLAVLSARANYLIALGDLVGHVDGREIPVYLRDSILAPADDTLSEHESFDYLVGNPPWIAWDNLPDEYRGATKGLWQKYGLFSLSGTEARHGGSKKDLSALMLFATADRYLKDGGRLAMVITQTLFQTKGAGDGFRRFRLGDEGPPLGVRRVNDMVALRPFSTAANWTATVLLEKGRETVYPVPYVKWSKAPGRSEGFDLLSGVSKRLYQAEPIDSGRPSSPWFLRPPGLSTPIARLVGPSDYRAHLGANSGGANGVYWLTLQGKSGDCVRVRNIAAGGKRVARPVEADLEPELLYPLLRWGDVARWRAVPSAHLLLTQDTQTRKGIDEALMADRYPKTLAYLAGFRRLLTARAAYKRYQNEAAFYSMYNVGPYTTAPIKVVWRRMDSSINAAVVEAVDDELLGRRPIIPQETCVLVASESSEEAHYLCALLNSSIVGFLVGSHSVRGGKGFGTPSILDFVRIGRFEPHDSRHAELAALGHQAHQATAGKEDTAEIEHQIDRLSGELWELSEVEMEVIREEVTAY